MLLSYPIHTALAVFWEPLDSQLSSNSTFHHSPHWMHHGKKPPSTVHYKRKKGPGQYSEQEKEKSFGNQQIEEIETEHKANKGSKRKKEHRENKDPEKKKKRPRHAEQRKKKVQSEEDRDVQGKEEKGV